MEAFLKVPNLPESKVTLAAVGNYPVIKDALIKEGIRVLSLESNILPAEVSRHSDMLLCHIRENTVFSAPDIDKSILEKEGFSVIHTEILKNAYPDDVKLNCAVSDTFFICNKKTVDISIHDMLIKQEKKPIYVNQGYSKCSVCFVTENAVITEDKGIFEALKNNGIDTLLISKGDIYLSDSHYGFFGGCTGKLGKNVLAVTGNLRYHKDRERISDFCKKYGVRIKELTKGRLSDIGGILPLKEME